MSVHQLLYASGATRPLSPAEIHDILCASRRNNAKIGVTGMLLHADGSFIQILEGERRTVWILADRISADAHHRNFMVLYENTAEARGFADWQMGFHQLDTSRSEDAAIFGSTREAIETRVNGADGILRDIVLAFGRDFIAG